MDRRELETLALIAVVFAVSGAGCRPAQSGGAAARLALEGELVHAEDFESGGWDGSFWHPNWCQFDYSCQVVPSPDGPGLAFRAEYRPADCDGSRPTMGDELSSGGIEHDEQWIGMRIYFSSTEFGPDSYPMILFQHHGRPDFDLGEDWRNPVTALTYDDGALTLRYRGSTDRVTPRVDGRWQYTDEGTISLGPPTLDAWNHFVIHTVWAPTSFTGLMEVWHDGAHHELRDINISYNDANRPYVKFGQYNWTCQSDHPVRVSFYDDVTIVAGPEAVFCDVVPPGSPMPPGLSCGAPAEDPRADGPFSPLGIEGCDAVAPVLVRASSFEAPNYPSNALDGDLATRWSAEGDGEWIDFDLGGPVDLAAIWVAFHRGDERTAVLDLLVSDDGVTFDPAGTLVGDGTALDPVGQELAASGRWVRVVGHGTSVGAWNSLAEVVLCRDAAAEPPEDGGPTDDAGADADADADADGDRPGADAAPLPESEAGCGCAAAGPATIPLSLGAFALSALLARAPRLGRGAGRPGRGSVAP